MLKIKLRWSEKGNPEIYAEGRNRRHGALLR